MTAAVILTVKIAGARKEYDMELPANSPMKELTLKLLMAFKEIERDLFLGVESVRVKYDADNRYLTDEETLESAAVWDGSVITVERMV